MHTTGMMSTATSLGLSFLWDTDVGLSLIDKYTYSSKEHIKAGALFTTGLLNTGNPTNSTSTSSMTSIPKTLKFL
jgi:26S proteasome regulatory subunit N1